MAGFLSLIVAAVGLVIYFATQTNAKLMEVGRIMFWTGLLSFLITNGERMVGLLGR